MAAATTVMMAIRAGLARLSCNGRPGRSRAGDIEAALPVFPTRPWTSAVEQTRGAATGAPGNSIFVPHMAAALVAATGDFA